MKVLLDENVPVPLHAILEHLLSGHEVRHVAHIGWAGKPDTSLLRDAGQAKSEAFVTNDTRQLSNPGECKAIQRSGMHHITYELPQDGLDGLALASGALCAALRGIVTELNAVTGQRLVRVVSLQRMKSRYKITNPATDPPNYWP